MRYKNMFHRHIWLSTALLFFSVVVFVPLASAAAVKRDSANSYFYVVCEDRRVYTIDITQGQVVAVSDEIPELGRPTCLDISRDGQILYIGSERGHWQTDFFPIVIVDLSTMKVQHKFHLELDVPKGEFMGISAVYELRVSPDGETLFAGYAHPKYAGGSVVVDVATGRILRHLGFYVRQHQDFLFSNDGRSAMEIQHTGVVAYDLEAGEKLSSMPARDLLASGSGLNPSWTRLSGPLSVIDRERAAGNQIRYVLRTIDRMTGKVLLEKDLSEWAGFGLSTKAFYRDSNQVILSMVGEDGKLGAVVRVDLQIGTFGSPIPVGQYPTNVVSPVQ